MNRKDRIFANIAILAFVSVVLVDALPSTCTAHQRARDALDPALDATGLWQQTWRLFAPNPDRVNTRISANIVFANGTQQSWNSPDWQNSSALQRFTHFRHMEYYDSLRMDSNGAAWEPFAKYISHKVAPGQQPVRVELTRHWVDIPEPDSGKPLMPVGGDWKNPSQFTFYRWVAEQ